MRLGTVLCSESASYTGALDEINPTQRPAVLLLGGDAVLR